MKLNVEKLKLNLGKNSKKIEKFSFSFSSNNNYGLKLNEA